MLALFQQPVFPILHFFLIVFCLLNKDVIMITAFVVNFKGGRDFLHALSQVFLLKNAFRNGIIRMHNKVSGFKNRRRYYG